MTVRDRYNTQLNIYDLVAIEDIPNSCLLTDKTESDPKVIEVENRRIQGYISKYAMVYYWSDDVENPLWYNKETNEISLVIRDVFEYEKRESILEFPLTLPSNCVRRLAPNPILMYPYGRFMLQIQKSQDQVDPDDAHSINDVKPPLELFDICKNILTTPLAELEQMEGELFQKFCKNPAA